MIKQLKGIIALDIDGTITKKAKVLDSEIEHVLSSLTKKGWQLIFLTGRTFAFASPLFAQFPESFFLGCQNGAQLFDMPSQKSLIRNYIEGAYLCDIENILKQEGVGLLIEMGKESNDICYYNPSDFSPEERDYLDFRISISGAEWIPTPSFSQLHISEFAAGKFFASLSKSKNIRKKIDFLKTTVTTDPFRQEYCVTLINAQNASKGNILKQLTHNTQRKVPIIAAGDDFNDVDMLQCADIKIVMHEGPEEVKKMADIIAPPFQEGGIIQALTEAINLVRNE